MKRTTSVLIGILLIAIFWLGCIESNGEVDSESGDITIGALLPLTGDVSSIGEASQAALEISSEDINSYFSGLGSGKNVKVVVKDTESNPGIALEQLRKLDEMGIKIVIGPQSSTEAEAVLDYATKNGIVLLSTASTAPSLAIPDDNLFRLVPDDTNQGMVLATLMEEEGISVMIPMYRNDVWGNGLTGEVEKSFENLNGTVVEEIAYETDNENLSAEVELLNGRVTEAVSQYGKRSVAVFLCSYEEATDIFVLASDYPALSEVNWYCTDGIALNRGLLSNKDAASFAVATNVKAPIYGYVGENDIYLKIGPRIEERLGRIPEPYALTTYDALWIATFVDLDAVPENDQSIKMAMNTLTGTYYGVSGWTILNENGDRKYWDYDIWKVTEENGSYQWEKDKRIILRGERMISF